MVSEGRSQKVRNDPDLDITVDGQVHPTVTAPCAKFD